jgi:hypothetical protein
MAAMEDTLRLLAKTSVALDERLDKLAEQVTTLTGRVSIMADRMDLLADKLVQSIHDWKGFDARLRRLESVADRPKRTRRR